MKKVNSPYIALIVLLVVSLFSFKEAHESLNPAEDWNKVLSDVELAKIKTIKIMESMPPEAYDFAPAKSVLAFSDKAHDAIHEVEFLTVELKDDPNWYPEHEYVTKKEAVIELASTTFDQLTSTLNDVKVSPEIEKSVKKFLLSNAEANGQMKIYLDLLSAE